MTLFPKSIKIITDAYELGKIECLECGRIIEADIPQGINGRYGNELKGNRSVFGGKSKLKLEIGNWCMDA